MSNIYAMPARVRHVRRFVSHLREADQREALALDGRPAILHLLEAVSLPSSNAFTVFYDNVPCGIFGVIEEAPEIGNPWMVGTPLLFKEREAFRISREVVDQMNWRYPLLRNAIHARNSVHIRWLEWMGFTIGKPFRSSLTGEPFRIFYRHV